MKIKKLSIKNFKSLIDIEINEPEPFTVFVGPNGSGKSNIFEAIQLAVLPFRFGSFPQSHNEWLNLFGGYESIEPKILYEGILFIGLIADNDKGYAFVDNFTKKEPLEIWHHSDLEEFMNRLPGGEISTILKSCRRLFINHSEIEILKTLQSASGFLDASASNTVNVLKRILDDETTKEEIIEWLQILIPELHKVEVQVNNLNGNGQGKRI